MKIYRKIVLAAILIVNVFLLSMAFNYSDKFGYKEIKNVKYSGINYDSRSKDPGLSSVKEYFEKTGAKFKELNLSFNMTAYSPESGNIFQTAPLDSGLRLEITPEANLNLVAKLAKGQPQSLRLVDKIKLNAMYAISLSIDVENRIAVSLNKLEGQINVKNMDYGISELLVGAGYDRTQKFDGKLSGFNIEYKLLEANRGIFPEVIKLLLIGSMLFVLYLLFKAWTGNAEEAGKEAKIESISFIILAGITIAVAFHYFLGFYLKAGYPLNTFLVFPTDN
ncbi:MAG: hypothetical protein WCI43_08975, partial [Candidatus Firestonebacteria bacterium]